MTQRLVDLAVVGGGVTGLLTLHRLLSVDLKLERNSLPCRDSLCVDSLQGGTKSSVERQNSGNFEKIRVVIFDAFDEFSPSCKLEYAVCIPFTGRRYETDSCKKIDQLLARAGDSGRRVRSIRISKSVLVAGREQMNLPSRLKGMPWCLDCCGQLTTSAAILEVPSYLKTLKNSIFQLARQSKFLELDFRSDKVTDCKLVDAAILESKIGSEHIANREIIEPKMQVFEVKAASGSRLYSRHLLLATSFQTNQIQTLVEFPHECSEGVNWQFSFSKALYDLDVVWHVDHLTFFVRDGSAYVYGVKADDEPMKIARIIGNLYGATDVDLISEWRGQRSHAKLKHRVYHFCNGSPTEILNQNGSGRFLEDLLSRGLERQSDLTAPILAINSGYGRNGFCQA